MALNASEMLNRVPTAPCQCDKPVPGIALEDRDGKVLETLCAQCRGAIRPKEEPGDAWAQYTSLFPVFPCLVTGTVSYWGPYLGSSFPWVWASWYYGNTQGK